MCVTPKTLGKTRKSCHLKTSNAGGVQNEKGGKHNKTGSTDSFRMEILSGDRGSSNGSNDRSLDAFNIALEQMWDGQPWYTSIVQLQLASLQFCVACRTLVGCHVRADYNTPRRLLFLDKESAAPNNRTTASHSSTQSPCKSTRVPAMRVGSVTWNIASSSGEILDLRHLANAETLVFGNGFNRNLKGILWPRRLKRLHVGARFNVPLQDGVIWPPMLEDLIFGEFFNQRIDSDGDDGFGVMLLPSTLKNLTFEYSFNQPIDGVVWPAHLRQVSFGTLFNQPIDGVDWPASISKITFGHCFRQAIDTVVWPASLKELTFARNFITPNRSNGNNIAKIQKVEWPASLHRLTIGGRFDEASATVEWPGLVQKTKVLSFEEISESSEDQRNAAVAERALSNNLQAVVWRVVGVIASPFGNIIQPTWRQ